MSPELLTVLLAAILEEPKAMAMQYLEEMESLLGVSALVNARKILEGEPD